MNTIVVQGITVDFSGVTSDGWKWRGKITLTRGISTATANLAAHSNDILVEDIEGEDMGFCDHIDRVVRKIEEALANELGDPRGREARRQAREDQETDWAIDERRMGL